LNYTQAGTPYYASPEVWQDKPYDFKSDVWSMGCIVYEMACLQLPFQAKDMESLFRRVVKGEYKPIPR
jgi:NIMA (never in mitosis gene a)-related kinase